MTAKPKRTICDAPCERSGDDALLRSRPVRSVGEQAHVGAEELDGRFETALSETHLPQEEARGHLKPGHLLALLGIRLGALDQAQEVLQGLQGFLLPP